MNDAGRSWDEEIRSGERYTFGDNWTAFLRLLDEDRIGSAEDSLKDMLGVESLEGKSFLDVGSGSGLFSLAARRLGAKVRSFDFDPQSVECTRELKRRYFPQDPHWIIEQGSVLHQSFLAGLGEFDIVYSWGVLHHTGAMWQALGNVVPLVATMGQLFISIYNDQGRASRSWTRVKRAYVHAPRPLKGAILLASLVRLWGPSAIRKILAGELKELRLAKLTQPRGMDLWHDAKDWVGGYPFEVAKPEQIFDFYRDRGFELKRMITCAGGLGCNQFVFVRCTGN